jgi:hypothetical protein
MKKYCRLAGIPEEKAHIHRGMGSRRHRGDEGNIDNFTEGQVRETWRAMWQGYTRSGSRRGPKQACEFPAVVPGRRLAVQAREETEAVGPMPSSRARKRVLLCPAAALAPVLAAAGCRCAYMLSAAWTRSLAQPRQDRPYLPLGFRAERLLGI